MRPWALPIRGEPKPHDTIGAGHDALYIVYSTSKFCVCIVLTGYDTLLHCMLDCTSVPLVLRAVR